MFYLTKCSLSSDYIIRNSLSNELWVTELSIGTDLSRRKSTTTPPFLRTIPSDNLKQSSIMIIFQYSDKLFSLNLYICIYSSVEIKSHNPIVIIQQFLYVKMQHIHAVESHHKYMYINLPEKMFLYDIDINNIN